MSVDYFLNLSLRFDTGQFWNFAKAAEKGGTQEGQIHSIAKNPHRPGKKGIQKFSVLPSEVSLNLPLLFFFLHFQGLKILPKPENLLFLLEGGVVSPDSRTSDPIPASCDG